MNETRIARALAVGILLTLAALPLSAQAPLRVGDVYEADITTPRNYPPGKSAGESAWVHQLTHPGATYIALHFRNFHLGQGDYLVVSDLFGTQSYVMEGRGKLSSGTFWAQHVKGDTVLLELVTTRKGGGSGFTIDKYAAGFADIAEPPTRAVCNNSDFENAVCRSPSIEYTRGRAVARLLIQGTSLCTGWLASAKSHLITNEHCISSSSAALNTDYEFGAEAPTCGASNCQLCWDGQIYSGSAFIQDNPGLDYALVQLSGDPAATYGYLEIDDRTASVGEEVYLVSHPGGRAKEFAYTSDKGPLGPTGAGTVISTSEPTCTGGTLEVGYWNDTQGGSSGSPVLAVSTQKVIALHHCRGSLSNCGNPNRGVPIDQICAEICDYLRPECADAADCDDSDICTADSCSNGTCSNDAIVGCCGNGDCETGEDCDSCAADCISGGTGPGFCGDGACNDLTEDCLSCPEDCNGRQNGKPANRFCCGDGGGENPVDCTDSRCSSGGVTCGEPVPYCCGDLTCEGAENGTNCEIDCAFCGNGTCDPGETSFDCPQDCPTCSTAGQSCRNDSDCCSLNCSNGPPASRVCQ